MNKIHSHLSSIFTENQKKKEKVHPKKTPEAQHTHTQEDIRNTQRHAVKTKTKNKNCTSHSNLTYAHIVKITFVVFIVPYRYLNTR